MREYGVQPTANRLRTLQAMYESTSPVSVNDLFRLLETIDRSNIFRILNTFKEHQIVQPIEDGCDSVKYEIIASTDSHTNPSHAHFHCTSCHKTFCLKTSPIPHVEFPKDYQIDSINYMAKGLCPKCSRKNRG